MTKRNDKAIQPLSELVYKETAVPNMLNTPARSTVPVPTSTIRREVNLDGNTIYVETDKDVYITSVQDITEQKYVNNKGISGFSGWSGTSGTSGAAFVGSSGYSGLIGESGYSGLIGESGTSGTSGYSGESGTSGTSGYSGESGASGTSGYSGELGPQGISGYSGELGVQGISGYSGTSGTSGLSGFSGRSGYSGQIGVSGYSGQQGATGATGQSGYSGWSGVSGKSGYSGASGTSAYSGQSGRSGYSGASGYSGVSGVSGFSGSAFFGSSGYSGVSGALGQSGYSGYPGAAGLNGDKYQTTSSTSNTIGTGSKTFTVGTGLAYSIAQSVKIAYDISNYIEATVTSYNSVTGQFDVIVDATTGSGTYNSWAINLAGAVGTAGDSGYSGAQGISGYSGAAGDSGYSGTSGFSGQDGASGFSGQDGASGFSGQDGASGFSGQDGASGFSGQDGASGFSGAGSPPAGSAGQVQYNAGSGTLGANAGFTYCNTTCAVGMNLIKPPVDTSLTVHTSNSNPPSWYTLYGDFGIDTKNDYSSAIQYDSSGNIYMVGADGAAGVPFLAKFDQSGACIWQKIFTDPSNYYKTGDAVTVDSSDNVYCAIGTDSGVKLFTLFKFDSTGTLIWSTDVGAAQYVPSSPDIAVDGSGNVYAIATVFDGAPTYTNDAVILKFDNTGSLVWQNYININNTVSYKPPSAVECDASGNAYALIRVSPGTGDKTLFVKFNTSGTLVWQKEISMAVGQVNSGAIKIDATGNIFVTGQYDSGTGTVDTYVIKFDSSGNAIWQTNIDCGGGELSTGIDLDSSGNVYVHSYQNTQTAGGYDYYTVKLDSTGAYLWARTFGSLYNEYTWWYWGFNTIRVYGPSYAITGYTYLPGSNGEAIVAQFPTNGSGTGTYGSFTYATATATTNNTPYTITSSAYAVSAGALTTGAATVTPATATNVVTTYAMSSANKLYVFDSNGGLTLPAGYALPTSVGSTGNALVYCGAGATGWANVSTKLDVHGSLAIGYGLTQNTGYSNIGIGINTLLCNTVGTNNTAFGNSSLQKNTTGCYNFAAGYNALNSNISGCNNIAIGFGAAQNSCVGNNNIALGSGTLQCVTTGFNNVAIGYFAGLSCNFGGSYENIAIGTCALANPGGSYNIAIGPGAYAYGNGGYDNVAVGQSSLSLNQGVRNVAMGSFSLRCNVFGIENTSIGYGTLLSNTTGCYNTAVGSCAGCSNTFGGNNTFLGFGAIGATATSDNTITLGNSSIACIRAQVTTISTLSDARDKKEVVDIPLGLDFILNLRPVKFTWNMRDGGKVDVPDSGFIAQDVAQLEDQYDAAYWLDMVGRENPEKLELKPAKLIPILVKALQELNEKYEQLKAKNNLL